jgi:hypothetical protein
VVTLDAGRWRTHYARTNMSIEDESLVLRLYRNE